MEWFDEFWLNASDGTKSALTLLVVTLFLTTVFMLGTWVGETSAMPDKEFDVEFVKTSTVYLETEDGGTWKCYRDTEKGWLIGCAVVAK
jgi:hypothetical protein